MSQFSKELVKLDLAGKIDFLRGHAESTSEMDVRREYDEDEMNDFREAFAKASIKLQKIRDGFDDVKREWKAKIKEALAESNGILNHIRLGYSEKTEEVFWILNPDTQMMECYDQYGDLIKTRKLRPDERQTLLPFNLNRASNE